EVCPFRPAEYVELVKTGALAVLLVLGIYSAVLLPTSPGTRLALALWSSVVGLALAARWTGAVRASRMLLPDSESLVRACTLCGLLLFAGLAVRAGAVVEGFLIALPVIALLHAWRPKLRFRLRAPDAFALLLLLMAMIATASLFLSTW
ncbi:MAG TPA: hypothetical protein VI893_06775, partial [Thermoplasmata archaeon]|nr:hypothetical protein [Thermoplasmata archaeon]